MRLGHRFAGRALLSAAFVVPVLSFGGFSHGAHATSLDAPVIAVYDATAQSHCKMWNGNDVSHAWSCPAGSVIYTNPETLGAAQGAAHRYVVPTSDVVATRKAIDTVARDLSVSLAAHATAASKFGPQYAAYLRHITPSTRPLGHLTAPTIPMGCQVGARPVDAGSYYGNGGGTIYYNVTFYSGPRNLDSERRRL